MQDKILKKLHLGFIQVHVLYHAKKTAFYGAWMIEELFEHGYRISPGTLYPMLHEMATQGLLSAHPEIVNGKVRKYYSISGWRIRAFGRKREGACTRTRTNGRLIRTIDID